MLRHSRALSVFMFLGLVGGCDQAPVEPEPEPGSKCVTSADCGSLLDCELGVCVDPDAQPSGGSSGAAAGGAAGSGGLSGSGGTAGSGGSGGSGGAVVCACTGLQTCVQGACTEPSTCLGEPDCLPGRFCVQGQCVDEAPECQNDSDCVDGSCDDIALECVAEACSSAEDCAGDQVCSDADECVDCADDDDCPGNQVCAGGSCDEPENCSADEDCQEGRVCVSDDSGGSGGSGGSAAQICDSPTCAPDEHEPNDDPGSAAALAPDTAVSTVVCSGDLDHFEVDAAAGDGLLARATFDSNLGQGELLLVDDTDILAIAEPQGEALILSVSDLPEGKVYLQVSAILGEALPVSLSYEIVSGGFCEPDPNEVDTPNDTPEAATAVESNPVGRLRGFGLCADDEDWYVVSVDAAKTLTITIETGDGDAPLAEVYKNGTSQEDKIVFDSLPSQTKTIEVQSDGATYYLRLFGPGQGDPESSGLLTFTSSSTGD